MSPEPTKPLPADMFDALIDGMLSGSIEIPTSRLFLVCHTCGGNFFSERRNRCVHLYVTDDGQRCCKVHNGEPCVAPRRPIHEPVEYIDPNEKDKEGRPVIRYHFEPSRHKHFYDYFYCLQCANEGLWPREKAYRPRPLTEEVEQAAMWLEGARDPDHVPEDLEPAIHEFLKRHMGHEVGYEVW